MQAAQAKYKQMGEQMKEAQLVISRAVKSSMEQWIAEDPARRSHLGVKPMNFVYPKGGPGIFKLAPAVVDALLMPGGLKKTQKAILAEVQQQSFPEFKLSQNIWGKTLDPKVIAKVWKRIEGNTVRPVSIRGCKNLSMIRRCLQAAALPDGEARTVTAKITFTKDRLIVGSKSYEYQSRKSGKNEYRFVQLPTSKKVSSKRTWVMVSALANLFLE